MANHGIQMPDGVTVEESAQSYGRFVIQPLERGFGVTIGNALRRVLLSSLQGVVVTGLRIDGVQHEFSTVPGVTEDVSDIILNLKGVRFSAKEYAGGTIHLVVKGPGAWTARDLGDATSEYDVLNPGCHIATLSEEASFAVELRVESGRGYVPAHENKREDDPIGIIAVDAIFTPIRSVRYTVKPTRVGQRIDYERLVIEVHTDGSVVPDDAMAQAATILRDHVNLFIKMDAVPAVEVPEPEIDLERQKTLEMLSQSVDELELSVRAHNCLKAANIKTIADLVRRGESDMLKFRNFGRKSLQELAAVLEDRGLTFGMDVVDYLYEESN